MRTNELGGLLLIGAGAIDNLAATGAAPFSWVAMEELEIDRLEVLVTGLVIGPTTVPHVSFIKQPVYNVNSGATALLGTVIVPNGTAAGVTVFKELKPISFKPGEQLLVNVDIAASGTAADGTCLYGVRAAKKAQGVLNIVSTMVESA